VYWDVLKNWEMYQKEADLMAEVIMIFHGLNFRIFQCELMRMYGWRHFFYILYLWLTQYHVGYATLCLNAWMNSFGSTVRACDLKRSIENI